MLVHVATTKLGMTYPTDDILNTGSLGHLNGTGAATSKSTNHNDSRLATSLGDTLVQGLLDIHDESILIGVGLDGGEGLARVGELPGPVLESKSSARKTSVETEGCDSATGLVGQELEVEKSTAATGETAECLLPATLVL